VNEPTDMGLDDYNRLKYEFFKLNGDHEGLKKKYRKVILISQRF